MKESAARMEKISYTMVLHKNVDGAENIFYTMEGILVDNPLVKWIGVIRRGTYQSASEDSRWAYEPVSDLWSNIEPASDSSDDGSSDEGSKNQDNPDGQEQEEVVSFPRRNPMRLRPGDQRALQPLKSDI